MARVRLHRNGRTGGGTGRLRALRLGVAVGLVAFVAPLWSPPLASGAVTPLPSWKQVGATPEPRTGAATAYDEATGTVVMFGGTDGDVQLGDTWSFDGRIWTASAATGPAVTDVGPMAYDPVLGKVVMLSGTGTAWAFDGTAWTQLSTGGPTGQAASGQLVFDTALGKLVLLGSSTWLSDGTTWTDVAPTTAPAVGYQAGMVYDADHQRVVVVVPTGTWEFDGATWSQITTAHAPPTRSYAAMAYDLAGHRTVLFSGNNGSNDTWTFDGTDWQQLTPAGSPASRSSAAAAYDAATGSVVVFGGDSGTADTWTLTGGTWSQIGASGLSTAYDAALKTAFGIGPDGSVWAWNGAAWVQRAAVGTVPKGTLVYDGAHAQLLDYGDDGSTTVSDGTTWTALTPAHKPTAQAGGVSLAYDSTSRQVVLFGGNGSLTSLNETWTWDGADWTQQNPLHVPPARQGAVMVDDPAHGDLVLGNGTGDSTGGTWTWSANDWATQSTTTTPTFAYPAGADYDADLGAVVVTAPTTSGQTTSSLWDGSAWQSQTPNVAADTGMSEVFDTARHQLVLTGAIRTTNYDWVASTTTDTVAVSVATPVLAADGVQNTTVTATVADASHSPVAGLPVTFATSGGQALSAVTDHQDGTYSVTMTSTTERGPFAVTAFAGAGSGSATFSQGQTLTVSPSVVAFGNSPVLITGQLPYAQVVTVTNASPAPVTLGALAWSGVGGSTDGAFAFGPDGCSATVLAAGHSCQVTVSFAPSTVGPQGATLVLSDSASDSPQQLGVSGTGTSVVTLSFSPSTMTFGGIGVGTATPQTVTATNVGAQQIQVTGVAWNGPNGDFAITNDTCSGQAVAVNGTCSVTVTFDPAAPGTQDAVLQFSHSGPDSPQSLSVTGTGVSGAPTLSPPSADFGTVPDGSTSAAQVFTLANPSTGVPVTVNSVGLSGKTPGQFGITNNCTSAVAPGASCTVSVTFSPTSVCTVSSATLAISTTPAVSLSSSLTGSASPPTGTTTNALTNYCTSFAAEPQDMAPGPDGNVWFDEYGSVYSPAAVASLTSGGTLTELPNLVPANWIPFNLTLGSDGNEWLHESRYGYYAQLARVAASGSFTQFIPPSGGPPLLSEKTASYGDVLGPDGNIWTGDSSYECANGPVLDRIGPNGVPTTTFLNLQWSFNNIPSQSSTPCLDTSHLADAPDGTVWATSLAESPGVAGLVHFDTAGDLIGFVANRTVSGITVGPDGNLWVTSITGTGPSCGLTELSPDGTTTLQTIAAPGTSGYFNCASPTFGADGRLWMLGAQFDGTTFPPTLYAVTTGGTVSSFVLPGIGPNPTNPVVSGPDESLWFRTGPSSVGRFDIGGGPARGFVSPTTIGFPSTPPGTPSAARTITLRSTGTSDLHVTGVAVTSAGYKVVSDGCTGQAVAPGSSCAVSVESIPQTAHSQSATLVFTDDDGFPATQQVALATFIAPPGPTFNPSKLVFAPQPDGTTSAAATVTLTNPADIALTIDATPSTGGANASDFSVVSSSCVGVIAPGGSCTTKVAFSPTLPAAETATLNFADSAIVSTQSVLLSGTGTSASGGGTCQCATAGPFVQPDVFEPTESATSPHGTYTLATVGQGANAFPSELDISKGGAVIARITGPLTADGFGAHSWGFSPDDDRFVVHYEIPDPNVAGQFNDEVDLYDLSGGTAQAPVTTPAKSYTDTATQAVGFSPLGTYLLVLTPTPGTVEVRIINATSAPYATAYTGDVTVGVLASDEDTGDVQGAQWGFAPGDRAFVDYYIDSNGFPAYDLVSLPTGTRVWSGGGTGVTADYVTFSPCGDVMAYWRQDASGAPNTVALDVISTSTGLPVGAPPSLPVGNVALSVVPPYWVITDVSSAPGLQPQTTVYQAQIPGCTAAATTSTTAGGGGVTAAALIPAGPRVFAGLLAASTGPPTALLLPDGRGELDLPADVTPSATTFTYTATPVAHPVLGLVPVGPGFHVEAADVATGAPVTTFADAVTALLNVTGPDLAAAGLTGTSGVGLYRWDGTTWVAQPCATCGVPAGGRVAGAFLQPGDFALLAALPADPPVTLTGVAVSATAGVAFTGTVATITPADAFDTPADYTVTVDWGDGTSSAAAVSPAWAIVGTHAWTAAGPHTITISLHDDATVQTITTTAIVGAGPASPSASALNASPASVPADGVSSSKVTVTLVDGAGNPAGSRTVTVTSTGKAVVSPASAVTDATGTATFTVSDATAEAVTLTATDTTDGVTLSQTANVTFTTVATTGADVAVSLSASRLSNGETGSYLVTVTNTGTAPTSGTLTVTDTLPAGARYLGVLALGWRCSSSGQVVTCTTTGRLAAHGHTILLIVVAVRARAGTALTDTVQVAMATTDPTPADNTASVTVVVRRG